jgi:hypothetical protein
MTNQQMAMELGRYIIQLQKEISVLEGVFMEFRIDTPLGQQEIPWRELAKKVAQEDGFRQIVNARLFTLEQAIHDETSAPEMILELYRQFIENENSA